MHEQILYFLKKAQGYLSGEEISRHLKISRAGIWKHMQELRKEGYAIEAVPHLGYRLVSSPDKLFPHEIQFHLETKMLGQKVFYYETVPSTMDAAFRLAMDGVPEGTVICAESQTRGRGRLGRPWSSPKAQGIYMSIILRPSWPPSEVARITLLASVAVAEALKKNSALPVQIKWPNDLLIRGRKLAGILTELNAEMDRVKFVVVGIGINVNASVTQLPKEATSLKIEAKRDFSRVEIVQEVLRSMEKWYGHLQEKGFSLIADRWRELSVTLKRQVCLNDPKGEVKGEAIDIDEDGGLLIRQGSGIVIKRMTGDVLPAR